MLSGMPEPVGSPAVMEPCDADSIMPDAMVSNAQQEQGKQARKERSREQKLAEAVRQFELKQQKKKEKHRGR